jgi:hypothetical protein
VILKAVKISVHRAAIEGVIVNYRRAGYLVLSGESPDFFSRARIQAVNGAIYCSSKQEVVGDAWCGN